MSGLKLCQAKRFVLLSLAAVAAQCGWIAQFVGAQAPAVPAAQAPAAGATVGYYPLDTVVSLGRAFIIDRNLPGVWMAEGNDRKVFIQGSKKYREPLNAARSIALDKDGNLLLGDSSTREIYRVGPDGKPQPLTGGAIGIPMDIAVRADGSLMVADLETRTLLKVSADGKTIKTIAKVNPRGVFVDHQDQTWVVSQDPQQLQIVSDDGTSKAIVDKRTFEFPHQVVVNKNGEAFVTDGYKKAVWKIAPGSAPEVLVSGAPLDNPVGIFLDGEDLVVTDPRALKLFRIRDGKCEPWIEIK